MGHGDDPFGDYPDEEIATWPVIACRGEWCLRAMDDGPDSPAAMTHPDGHHTPVCRAANYLAMGCWEAAAGGGDMPRAA